MPSVTVPRESGAAPRPSCPANDGSRTAMSAGTARRVITCRAADAGRPTIVTMSASGVTVRTDGCRSISVTTPGETARSPSRLIRRWNEPISTKSSI